MSNEINKIMNERDRVFIRGIRLTIGDKLNDTAFIDFMWNKYQLHLEKLELQKNMQSLVDSMSNNTFVPEEDIKMPYTTPSGKKGFSIIKDSPQRQWNLISKEIKDIEREERGGFKIDFTRNKGTSDKKENK